LQAAGAGVALSLGCGTASAAETCTPKSGCAKSLKLGIASYTFRKFDLEKTLAMTKRAGLEYVCLKDFHLSLKSTPEECAKAAAQVAAAGLKLYGCGNVSMKKPEDVDQAFAYAKAAGMKTIICSPQPELLPQLNQKVQEFDICIAIHNHGPGDKLWPTPQSVYEKIQGLDRRVGLCIDIGHTVRIGADLIPSIKMCADRLLDVHIKDIDAATEKGKCIQMGRGVLDLPAVFRTLLEIRYPHIASYEYEIEGDDPLPGLCESVGYTHGVLAAI
jgi:sugar phosphate isomerase/epimerase